MNVPQRIQASRQHPEPLNTRRVCRPSRYGNDYKIVTMKGTHLTCYAVDNPKTGYQTGVIFNREAAHAHAVEMHKIQMETNLQADPAYYDALLDFDYISCFCAPELPCHCDEIIAHLKERVKVLNGGAA